MPDNPLLRSSLHPANAPIAQPADRFSALNALAAAPSPTRRAEESLADWEARLRAWSSTQPGRVARETQTAATTRAATNRRIGNQSQQRAAARRAGNTAVAHAAAVASGRYPPSASEPLNPYNRNPYPQVNNFRPFVRAQLEYRRNRSLYSSNLVSRAPFARMTSGLKFAYNHNGTDLTHQFLSLGLEGYENTTHFNQIYTDGSVIGYAINISTHEEELIKVPLIRQSTDLTAEQMSVERQANNLYHSPPGITSIRVEKRSAKGVYKSVVTWKCYDRNQLEALRSHFLTAGGTIVLEWGQLRSATTALHHFNFGLENDISRAAKYFREGKDTIIYEYVDVNSGNADCVVGFCSNLEISLEQDGSFTCTTHIMSMPETIFGVSNIQTMMSDNPSLSNNIVSVKDYYLPKGSFEAKLQFDYSERSTNGKIKEIINTADSSDHYRGIADNAGAETRGEIFATTTLPSAGNAPAINPYFISWAYFIYEIIPDSLAMYQPQFGDIQRVISMVNRRNESTTVSYAPSLASTDPGVLVVFNTGLRTMADNAQHPSDHPVLGEDDIHFFSPTGSLNDKALLESGVYINAGKIIEVFSTNEKFIDALEALLSSINTAMGGYWNLQLIFDEAIGKYIIVDEGQISLDIINRSRIEHCTHIFNSGSMSELLECSFKSTLGDLEKANIMMASLSGGSIRTSTLDQTNARIHTLHPGYIDYLKSLIEKERNRFEPTPHTWESPYRNGTERVLLDAELPLRNRLMYSTTIGTNGATPVNILFSPLFIPMQVTGHLGTVRPRTGGIVDLHAGEDYRAPAGSRVRAMYTGTLTWGAHSPRYGTKYTLRPDGMPTVEIIYIHLGPSSRTGRACRVNGGDVIGVIYDLRANATQSLVAGEHENPTVSAQPAAHLHLEYRLNGIPVTLLKLFPSLQSGEEGLRNARAAARIANTQVPLPEHELVTLIQQSTATATTLALAHAGIGATEGESRRLAGAIAADEAGRNQARVNIYWNYGYDISPYIAISPTGMLSSLVQGTGGSNPFNGPSLVKVELELTILGIGGISITDCFKMDKIPEQYMQKGVFMVRSITENITSKGWTTTLTAMLLFTDCKPRPVSNQPLVLDSRVMGGLPIVDEDTERDRLLTNQQLYGDGRYGLGPAASPR